MKNANGWSQLQLRHLAALQAVARERSFGAAAAELGYTQSAISHQIGALEQIVGAKLVERPGGRRPVSLTRAGALLLDHADAIVARAQAAKADLASSADGASASLRVSTYQSIGARILPELLGELAELWPNVAVELHEANSFEEPFELIERGELDLGFVELPAPPGPFEIVPLAEDRYVLVVPADSELAHEGEPVALERLDGLGLVGFRECGSERRVLEHLRTLGIKTSTALSADDNRTIQGLVAARRLAAVVPRLTAADDDPDTVVLALDRPLPPRRLGIAYHSGRHGSDAAHDFIRLALRFRHRLEDRPSERVPLAR